MGEAGMGLRAEGQRSSGREARSPRGVEPLHPEGDAQQGAASDGGISPEKDRN